MRRDIDGTDEAVLAAEALSAAEAHRASIRVDPDALLTAAGWQFRFVTDGPRAEEWLATYQQLGFETCAEPIAAAQISPLCGDCRLVALLRYRAIYTRRLPLHAPSASGPTEV